jgi:Flp pilus assembly protein TadG
MMKSKAPLSRIRDVSGQSLVELALVLPVLIGMVFGIIDISRAIYAYNSIANLSREGADLASRSGQTYSPQQIMDVLAQTAQPLAMDSNGMIYITRAQSDGSTWTFTREAWQNKDDPPSTVADSASITALVGPIGQSSGKTVCICEVYYKYHSLFLPTFFSDSYAPLLHSTAIF